jgi:hypothetical protein
VHEPVFPPTGLAGAESEPDAAGPRDPALVERRPVLEQAGSVVEEGFVRRVRTLLRTAPVHRLAAITGWREWKDAPYDPRVLSQAIIDAVVARTGFTNQLTYDDAMPSSPAWRILRPRTAAPTSTATSPPTCWMGC